MPEAWNTEKPRLYTLVATLIDPAGNNLESRTCRTGFRSIEIKDGLLLLNGRRILIKGANRHEHHEVYGKTISMSSMLQDAQLLKQNNFNAVRTSHYPNDERWYDICDEYGLLLIDEANIEAHAHYGELCNEPQWMPAFVDRVSRMAIRDRNHPSVIIWSLGNESGYGPNHDAAAAWLRYYDPDRPLHYEGAFRPRIIQGPHPLDTGSMGRSVSDIVYPMYPTVAYLEEWDRSNHDSRPLIMCEYVHAMGNSCGSLQDYWNVIEKSRSIQGGFIWEWADHGIFIGSGGANTPTCTVAPGTNGKPWRYGGDFNDSPSDREFVTDGLLFPDRMPKPALQECAYIFRPVRFHTSLPESIHTKVAGDDSYPLPDTGPSWGRYYVENRYDFSDLSKVRLRWQIISGSPYIDNYILSQGIMDFPSIAPGACAPLRLPLPTTGEEGRNLRIAMLSAEAVVLLEAVLAESNSWAQTGTVLARDWFPLSPPTGPLYTGTRRQKVSSPLIPGFDELGFLSSLSTIGGKEFLNAPLIPCLFRAPTQNDGIKTFREYRGKPEYSFFWDRKYMYQWEDAGLSYLSFKPVSNNPYDNEGCLCDLVTSTGRSAGRFFQHWHRDSDSQLKADFILDLESWLPELPRVGLVCSLASGLQNATWFGRGPHEAYPDRCSAAAVGHWESEVEALSTPYIIPQASGNRHDTRWLSLRYSQEAQSRQMTCLPVTSEDQSQLLIPGDKPFDWTLTPYTDRELSESLHWDRLPRFDLAMAKGTVLHLDTAHRGVGSASCGPDVLSAYQVHPTIYRWSLVFSLLPD